jgi:hypothetical protein
MHVPKEELSELESPDESITTRLSYQVFFID